MDFLENTMPNDEDKNPKQSKVDAMNATAAKSKKWPADEPEESAAQNAPGNIEIEEAPGLEHPEYKELEDKLTEMEKQAHAHWNELMRAKADAENIERNARRNIKFALDKFCQELLPVADSIERGLSEDVRDNPVAASFHEGMQLTLDLLMKTLSKYGVEQIDPLGDVFDPAEHEAVSIQEDPSAKPNTVVSVIQKGYRLHDRVIRHAMVVVAKG